MVVYEQSEDWSDGSFNATTVDNTGSLGNIQLGYLDGNSTDRIEVFYRFDSNLDDYSGNNVDSIGSRNLSYKAGIAGGQSAYFSTQNSSYIEYPDSSGINNQQFTVGSWVYLTEQQQSEAPIIQKDTSNNRGFKFLIDNHYGTDRVALFLYSSTTGEQRYRSDIQVPKNEWVHLAAGLDSSGQVVLYMNGQEIAISSDSSTLPASYDLDSNDFTIGATSTQSGGDYFDGRIDEVRIISDFLNSSEIRKEYLNGFNGSYKSSKFEESGPYNFANITSTTALNQSHKLNLTVLALDGNKIQDSQDIELIDGVLTKQVNVANSSSYRINLSGSSSNSETTWSLQKLELGFRKYNFSVDSITINDSEPVENEQILLQSEVSNSEKYPADVNLSINIESFSQGTWDSIANYSKVFTSSGSDSNSYSETFKPSKGPHRINLTVDPNDLYPEVDGGSNNQKELYFDVPLYTWFYGNITLERSLKSSRSFYNWSGRAEDGTIYFADSDADIDFSNLKAVSDYSSLKAIDQKLNSTGFNDSIAVEWGSNQQINNTGCFVVNSQENCNVPVSLTEHNSSFNTGIMYDGQLSYSDQDPLVFITNVKEAQEGAFGKNNYEIKVPSALSASQGENDAFDIYAEIS